LPREGALLQSAAAEMQMLNWNDLRYVLAISRGKTLGAAARLLGVDDTTVARRLIAVQEAVGARLYQRLPDGTLQLTTAGERAALHAERIEREIIAVDASVAGANGWFPVRCALLQFRSSSVISSFRQRKRCSRVTRNCTWNSWQTQET
jgi:DNA-binding transcriptional LysR family regulator